LYRCGLRLEEISEQLQDRVTPSSGQPIQQARRNSYSEVLNRPRDNPHKASSADPGPEGDLHNLMQVIKNLISDIIYVCAEV